MFDKNKYIVIFQSSESAPDAGEVVGAFDQLSQAWALKIKLDNTKPGQYFVAKIFTPRVIE